MTGLQTGELAAMATAFLWTLSTLAWTIAGRRVGSLPVAFLRLLITCVLLSAYGWLVLGHPFPMDVDVRTWWLLGMSGFLGFFVCDVCLFEALVLIGPRLTLLLHSLVPPLTAIVSWLFLSEGLTVLQIGAMLITIAGVVWVILERQTLDSATQPPNGKRWGVTLANCRRVERACPRRNRRVRCCNGDVCPDSGSAARISDSPDFGRTLVLRFTDADPTWSDADHLLRYGRGPLPRRHLLHDRIPALSSRRGGHDHQFDARPGAAVQYPGVPGESQLAGRRRRHPGGTGRRPHVLGVVRPTADLRLGECAGTIRPLDLSPRILDWENAR